MEVRKHVVRRKCVRAQSANDEGGGVCLSSVHRLLLLSVLVSSLLPYNAADDAVLLLLLHVHIPSNIMLYDILLCAISNADGIGRWDVWSRSKGQQLRSTSKAANHANLWFSSRGISRLLFVTDLLNKISIHLRLHTPDVVYLWCEVESQVGVVAEPVLHEKWHFIAQAQLHLPAETTSLAEVHQVLERECECDWLSEVDLNVLVWLVHICVRAQSDRAVSDITSALEAHAVLCALDRDWSHCQWSGPNCSSVPNIPDSESADRSLVMRWNSGLGNVMVAAYSVSGIPKCS